MTLVTGVQGHGGVVIIFLCLKKKKKTPFHLGRSFSFLHLRRLQSPQTAAQLVVCAPLLLYTLHQYSDSPTGCPPTFEFLEFACLCFNAVTSTSTPACLSGLLQLCSPSWSLYPGAGICLLPLPPCRCGEGGDCAFSRLGRLSGAHCHFTSGM